MAVDFVFFSAMHDTAVRPRFSPSCGRLFSRTPLGRLNCLLFSVWHFWPNGRRLFSAMHDTAVRPRFSPSCGGLFSLPPLGRFHFLLFSVWRLCLLPRRPPFFFSDA